MNTISRIGYTSMKPILTLVVLLALAGCGPADDTSAPSAPEQDATIAPAAPETAETAAATAPEADTVETVVSEAASFESRDAAVEALMEAVRNRNRDAFAALMGPGFDELVPPGSMKDEDVAAFLAAFDKTHRFIDDPSGASFLAVGEDEWTFPVPIVESEGAWMFDLEAGAEEVLVRMVGRNELSTIQAALAFVDAQREYAAADRNGDGVLEYAQRFRSTEGQQDGLYWPVAEGEEQSPLGPLFADVTPEGSYHGYLYRILGAQGPNATGGAFNYVIGGRMTGGFGLIAWPFEYAQTGVKTFIVNHEGVVYEKDLGAETSTEVETILTFDPDDSWSPAEPLE